MHSARKRILLFLGCAVVMIAAGYAWGYAAANDRFYAPEALLDNELVNLDFNNRLLHYANLNQAAEFRRELSVRLQEQIALVDTLTPDCRDPGSRREALKSVQNARQVMGGQPLVAVGLPATRIITR